MLMLSLSCLILIGPTLGQIPNPQEQQANADRFERAKAHYEEVAPTLTDQQKAICQKHLETREAEVANDNRKLIAAYKELYLLCVQEQEEMARAGTPGRSTLFEVFHYFYTSIPMMISTVCYHDETMTMDEKIAEMKAQMALSTDSRIGRMIVDLLRKDNRFEEAISLCQEQMRKRGQIHAVVTEYRYELVRTYLGYQDFLFRKAAQEQGISMDRVVNEGPHLVKVDYIWLEKARTEGAEFVEEANRLLDHYRSLFVGSQYLWMSSPTVPAGG